MSERWSLERFDRLVIVVMVALVAAIAGVVLAGDHVQVYVAEGDFGPQGTASGAQPIYIRFSDAMSSSSVAAHFRIEPSVPGEITWTGPNALIFTPQQPWLAGRTYTVTVERGAQAARHGGVLPEAVRWTFTVRLPKATHD